MIQERSLLSSENLRPKYFSLWWLRGLLGGLLTFGSEILLWSNPESRTLLDFLLILVVSIALGAIIVDLAVRYRIRNLYDAMTLIAIYGVLASVLIYPDRTTGDLPRMLGTRILGGYTLIGLEMFGLFLVLMNGANRHRIQLLVGWSICVGFAWAIWVHWSPSLINWIPNTVSFNTMLLYAVIFLIPTLILFLAACRFVPSEKIEPAQLRLSIIEWLVIVLLCLGILIAHLANNTLPISGLLLSVVVVAVCWVVLWFRRTEGGTTLMSNHIPMKPLSFVWIGITVAVFLIVAAFVYQLPLVTILGYSQFSVVEFAFVGVGFLWLPTIAAALGTETFSRQLKRYD